MKKKINKKKKHTLLKDEIIANYRDRIVELEHKIDILETWLNAVFGEERLLDFWIKTQK